MTGLNKQSKNTVMVGNLCPNLYITFAFAIIQIVAKKPGF